MTYVSADKITFLIDIVNALPLICKKDKNASTAIYSALNTGKEKSVKIQEIRERDEHQKASKNDPYIQKLCELIYVNVSKRFQVFGNAYCYLDFKGRQMVSFADFKKGLEGLQIKMTSFDALSVFQYLTDTDDNTDSVVFMA